MIEREKQRVKKGSKFRHRLTLDNAAREFGIFRENDEPDNILWAKIENHPDFESKREETLDRVRGAIDSFKVHQEEFNFMNELGKL